MKKLFLMLLAATSLVACDKGGEDASPKTITVPNQQQLTQTVYADDNAGKSGVTFKTIGAWTSEIAESATAKSTRAAADWLSISPSSGDKAGDYTISIALKTNYTGKKRSATISLKCSGEMVSIVVTQEALTAAGDKPEPDPEPSGEGVLKNETTGQNVKLTGITHHISNPTMVDIEFVGEKQYEDKDKNVWFHVEFVNPLENGKLKSGTYKVNISPQTNLEPGECYFRKSTLVYFKSGTIKVEGEGDMFKFTFDGISIGEDHKFTGSFTGVPEYLNKEVKVASVTLNETTKTLPMGEYFALTATILPENATDKSCTWRSSNPAVATVSETGFVQSVSAGTATITAISTEGAKTATCAVTVNPAIVVTGITVSPNEVTLVEGDYLNFYLEEKVTIMPKNATNKKVTWVSSDETIATYTGKAVEAQNPGAATITFTTDDGAKTATLKVTVTQRPSLGSGSIKTTDASGKVLSQYNIANVSREIKAMDEVNLKFLDNGNTPVSELTFYGLLDNGELKTKTYQILDHFTNLTGTSRYGYVQSPMWGKPASTGGTYQYYYKSGSVSVVKLGDNYTITFNDVKTNSTLGFQSETITCSYNGTFNRINEFVAVNSVTLNKTSLSLTLGSGNNNSAKLDATVNPSNAFNQNVKWSTSDENVASVYGDGYVNATGAGSATITVTTEDGAKTASCQVAVSAQAATGNGTFSNNSGKSITANRAIQWVNEKEPTNIDLRFTEPNAANEALSLTLFRAAGDTGELKAGTYNTIRYITSEKLDVKYSYENTGSATVTLSGENYTMTLNVTCSDGTIITGTYTGKIISTQ